jgi:hypothetical protein
MSNYVYGMDRTICDIGVFVGGNSDQYGLYLFPFLEMHIFLLGNKYFFI